jgi:hypothetical protein
LASNRGLTQEVNKLGIFSSKSEKLFYESDFTPYLPPDAVEISISLHIDLLAGQSSGKRINFDTEPPSLADAVPMTPGQLGEIERIWRDGQLATTDSVVARHRDELESGTSTTLTIAQYSELQVYRRALRDWPQGAEFPLVDHRPAQPEWLAEQFKTR